MGGVERAVSWNGRRVMAWIPDPLAGLSPNLSPGVIRRTERAAAAVRRADDHLPVAAEPLARLLLRAEGVASSNIEGIRAPLADVVAAELDPVTASGSAAWVAGNLAAIAEALAGAQHRKLSVAALHRWHRQLMASSPLSPPMIGAFRRTQSWIGGRSPLDAAFVPPPAEEVGRLMADLVAFANDDRLDTVTQAALVHAQFETIHPYGDGNGRIGRVLVLWVLARRLAVATPPPLSTLLVRDPGGYLSGLYWFRIGEVDRWVGWFAEVVERAGETESEWAESIAGILDRWSTRTADLRADSTARSVLGLLPALPVTNATVVANRLGVSDRTARAALADLADRGILAPFAPTHRRGGGRPSLWWLAP
ncbi:MAG: Fic family protein, partial [Acidimicrobiales bacterium]